MAAAHGVSKLASRGTGPGMSVARVAGLVPCLGVRVWGGAASAAAAIDTPHRQFATGAATPGPDSAPLFRTDAEASRKMWNSMSASYDGSLFEYYTSHYAKVLARRVNAGGSSVLDLGCGTGQVSLELVDRYEDAKVDAVDISEDMVAGLERKLGELDGAARITPSVADAAALPAEWDERYDMVIANLSLMFVSPEAQHTAFAEIGRVLKPGGIAFVSSWSIPRDNPGIGVFYEALDEALRAKQSRQGRSHTSLAERTNPNFSLCAPRVIKEMLALGGLGDARVAKFAHTYDGSVDDYVAMGLRTLEATPLEGEYQRVFQQELATRAALRANARELTTMINVGMATKL